MSPAQEAHLALANGHLGFGEAAPSPGLPWIG